MALATSIAACGSGSSSDSNEPAGKYQVKVTKAVFPTEQQLAQTSLLRLGVRNTGQKTVPALAITISIAGKAGQTSSLPFGYHDPQAGIAQPDRPVWVLAEHFPKLAGSKAPGGATTSSPKTFDFGPLKPGQSAEAVWKVTAVKTGHYTVLFSVDAGLGGQARAETGNGGQPGGSFATTISRVPPHVVVTDSGEVVEVKPKQRGE
ncbi:MAG TPA: hypothetical protein VG518_09855 [Solirubrobacterales bacterium]|nr:hypothetical protein [Solirubrobacterales bacterium]